MRSGVACVIEESHSFTHRPTELAMTAFTPHPQSIAAVWPVLVAQPTEVKRLSLPGWLVVIWLWYACPEDRHPSHYKPGPAQSNLVSHRDKHAATPPLKQYNNCV